MQPGKLRPLLLVQTRSTEPCSLCAVSGASDAKRAISCSRRLLTCCTVFANSREKSTRPLFMTKTLRIMATPLAGSSPLGTTHLLQNVCVGRLCGGLRARQAGVLMRLRFFCGAPSIGGSAERTSHWNVPPFADLVRHRILFAPATTLSDNGTSVAVVK